MEFKTYMVGKVQKLAFHRILRFVISSFLEGVMTILLLKGQTEFLRGIWETKHGGLPIWE